MSEKSDYSRRIVIILRLLLSLYLKTGGTFHVEAHSFVLLAKAIISLL